MAIHDELITTLQLHGNREGDITKHSSELYTNRDYIHTWKVMDRKQLQSHELCMLTANSYPPPLP